jgi:hypothetical protein
MRQKRIYTIGERKDEGKERRENRREKEERKEKGEKGVGKKKIEERKMRK